MNYFKKYSWILPILGGFIALISLFTPTTYDRTTSELILIWMNQLAVRINDFTGLQPPELWRYILWLNLHSIAFELIIFASAIITITLTNIYRKSSKSYQNLKWKLLFFAFLIVLSTLGWIIIMEIFYLNGPQRHWEWYSPHFGVIGPFIGASLIILGAFLTKDISERKKTETKLSIQNLKKLPLLLTTLGGLIALISLFTPTSFNYRYGTDLNYVWINHLAINIEPGPIEPYLLGSRADLFLVCFSIALAGIILASVVVLITLTNTYRKTTLIYQKLKWKWFIIAILISLSTLTWIIMIEFFYVNQGYSHWQNYTPHFGVIGPFIGSGLIMVAFFQIKGIDGRE